MAYYYHVVTKERQDAAESAARDHVNALNAYLGTPGVNGKMRREHSRAMTQLNINMYIVTTTILCCNEDEDEDDK